MEVGSNSHAGDVGFQVGFDALPDDEPGSGGAPLNDIAIHVGFKALGGNDVAPKLDGPRLGFLALEDRVTGLSKEDWGREL